ncbi:ricin-type beta-trefoil lectin domain protein [Embleya sp. NPDC020886]|uniref:ricin-type beta-trefoil lectin domain protein n=1 Tax=Embleya sp. NPDC020886 TaxID=3363980 RepID=UPI0037A67B50
MTFTRSRPYATLVMLLALTAAFLTGTTGSASAEPTRSVPVAAPPEDQPRLLREMLAKQQSAKSRTQDQRVLTVNQLLNWNSGKCMVALPSGELWGVMQYRCNTAWADQQWSAYVLNGYVRVPIDYFQRCLESQQATVTTHQCGDYISAQMFEFLTDTTGEWFMIRNREGKCLYANGTADNGAVSAYTCNNTYADQWWKWTWQTN